MKGTTTAPYFKFDTGQFLAETMGLTDATVGLYIRMMSLYWESGCTLPDDKTLKMKLGVRTKQGRENLALVLETFFDEYGKHERLDSCLVEVRKFSQMQSERAKGRNRVTGQEKLRSEIQVQKQEFPDGDF